MSGLKADLKKQLKKASFNRYQFKGQDKPLSSASTADLIVFAKTNNVL
jgi:hypothetical protein